MEWIFSELKLILGYARLAVCNFFSSYIVFLTVKMSFSGFLLCSVACNWIIFLVWGFWVLPHLFFKWSFMQRAFLKGEELMSSSKSSSIPGDVYEPVPAPSFRGISEWFRSQVLPSVTAGQLTSTSWVVRGRDCRFLLFPVHSVYSLESYCTRVLVSDTGSSSCFVKPKPQVSDISQSCRARGTDLVLGLILGCAKRKKGHS